MVLSTLNNLKSDDDYVREKTSKKIKVKKSFVYEKIKKN